jgi:translation elongation factor EF-4
MSYVNTNDYIETVDKRIDDNGNIIITIIRTKKNTTEAQQRAHNNYISKNRAKNNEYQKEYKKNKYNTDIEYKEKLLQKHKEYRNKKKQISVE